MNSSPKRRERIRVGGARRLVDDAPVALLRHDRRRGLPHQPRAELVHPEHLLQVVEARIEVVDVVVQRGVVDEDVDGAERLDRPVDARLRGRLVGDVGLHEQRVALARERLHGRGGALLVDLGDHDLGALVEEPLRVREADALSRTGDDRDLVLQTSHARVSLSYRSRCAYRLSRAIRLNRSVTTGEPSPASLHCVSMTTKVMSRGVGFLFVDVGDRLHAVEHVARDGRAVVDELLLAVQDERALRVQVAHDRVHRVRRRRPSDRAAARRSRASTRTAPRT